MGGRAALGKITTRKGTGTVTITTPNGDVSGPIEVYAKAPNKSRATMQLDLSPVGVNDRMVIDQRFDGTSGKTTNSLQGDTEITGGQLDNMRNNTFPSSMLNYKAAGATLELLPKEQINGKDVLVLRLTPKAGPATRFYLDAQTYLIARVVTRLNMAELGEMEQMSEPSDYRTVDGIKVPFVIVNSNAIQRVTIRLATVAHNVAIDDAMFVVRAPF